MQEIKQTLKTIQADVASIKMDVAKNTVSLEHHIKRTDLLQNLVVALILCVIGVCIKAVIS